MKFHFVLLGIAISLCVSSSSGRGASRPRPAPPKGVAWDEWQELIGKHFGHSKIEFTLATGPLFAGGHDGCPKGPFGAPGLMALVSSRTPKVFGNIEVAIFNMKEGADGYRYLRDAIRSRPTETSDEALGVPEGCAFVGNTAVAAIQVGAFWVEVYGHCYDGALFRYEVGDAITMLGEKDPTGAPKVFALSECGRGTPVFQNVGSFLEQLRKPASYWGRRFPDVRYQARNRPSEK